MATATIQPAKLTLKQSFLINFLRGMFFVFRDWMHPTETRIWQIAGAPAWLKVEIPPQTEVFELLDKADRIAGDERAIFIRKVSTCSKQLTPVELQGLELEILSLYERKHPDWGNDEPREV